MTDKKKSKLWILVFILVTLLPVFGYFYFKDSNDFKKTAAPEKKWPQGVDDKGDSIYFKLPELAATNADGNIISTHEMDGNVSVVECFFVSCQSICPIMNKQMERVHKSLKHNDNFKIFSYTVDPERDNLERLKAYAENHGANLNNWYFLRTSQDTIFDFGRNSLKLPTDNADEIGDFIHSDRFVLVDWDRNIRGYYYGTDSLQVNQMMSDIVLLLSEKERIDKKAKNVK